MKMKDQDMRRRFRHSLPAGQGDQIRPADRRYTLLAKRRSWFLPLLVSLNPRSHTGIHNVDELNLAMAQNNSGEAGRNPAKGGQNKRRFSRKGAVRRRRAAFG